MVESYGSDAARSNVVLHNSGHTQQPHKTNAGTDDIDILRQIADWQSKGQAAALATVVRTWGSSPRPLGSHLAINEKGEFIGSVSGGCIETAVITEALSVIADGAPRLLNFDVVDAQAWEVGLSCGGKIQIHVEKIDSFKCQLFERLRALYEKKQAAGIIKRMSDGAFSLLHDGEREQSALLDSERVHSEAIAALRAGRSGFLPTCENLFLRVYPRATHLFVVGAVHIAQCLVPMAKQAGFVATVIDPRLAFATRQRFADTELLTEWPDAALMRVDLAAADAVIALSHDPKLDDPALAVALRSPAFYIGALGSKRTHVQRVTRLRALGFDTELDRIHAPIGLPLGGRAPAEIAIAILAEVIKEKCALCTPALH
ncbi:MAG TPA: XdhC family protein [Spongiibacteraceae bacterium]|nr:XdhC family protein [Spongiibacteraceae bacterium]